MRRALALIPLLLVPLAPPGPAVAGVGAPAAVAALPAVARAPAGAPWRWPVDPPHRVIRAFIAPATVYAAGHRGVDLLASSGVVYAPTAGVVHFAGVVVDRPVLSIRHPGGIITSYEPVESTLTAGAPVARGAVLGEAIGGHCTSLCLHFGVRVDGQYVSPLLFLGGVPRSVLLPTR